MDRRALLGMLVPFVVPLPLGAQPAGKVYRVGYLATDSGPITAGPRPSEVFRQALRDLGWVEGQNIAIGVSVCGGAPRPASQPR